jgi:hypothetical protein
MNYIVLSTHSLVTLVGRNEKDQIAWENMGTNADLINLTYQKFSACVNVEQGIYYILPINNIQVATEFAGRILNDYGITASIVDNETALTLISNAQGSEVY